LRRQGVSAPSGSARRHEEQGEDVIKVVVAYVDAVAFDAIRSELGEHGIVSLSVAAAGGASPERFVAPNYRGTPHTLDLHGKLRVELVVGADHVDIVREIIFRNEQRRSFMFVMPVEAAYPDELVRSDATG
jgi:nitrogen regulatory protein PII